MAEEKHGSVTINRARPTPAGGEPNPWAGVFNRKEPEMATQPEIEMEALKTHLGASGGQVRKGARYTVNSEATAAEHVRLGIGERISPEAAAEEPEGAEADELAKPWPLAMTPEAYVDKYGDDAKHSAHARAVIEREKALQT